MELTAQYVRKRLQVLDKKDRERKVFGSPFFFIGDEPFWGHDRISYLDEWLAKGGW